jgi:hypothetical protein
MTGKRSWIQVEGRLIPKEQYFGDNLRAAYVLPDIEPFVSSVDGKPIMGRRQLREHNKVNDVVQYAEFSPEYIEKKVKERHLRLHGQTREDKQDRIENLKRAMEQHRS